MLLLVLLIMLLFMLFMFMFRWLVLLLLLLLWFMVILLELITAGGFSVAEALSPPLKLLSSSATETAPWGRSPIPGGGREGEVFGEGAVVAAGLFVVSSPNSPKPKSSPPDGAELSQRPIFRNLGEDGAATDWLLFVVAAMVAVVVDGAD